MIRDIFVFLHRWVGLLMTVFLVIVGLTGSLLTFNTELEHIFAPQLFAKPHPGEAPLDLATIAERAAPLVPRADLLSVTLSEPDQAQVFFWPKPDPATGKPFELGFTQFYVDPWTGAELGRRTRADLSEGLINVMPFIYKLHDALMLKATGATILGIVAVFWTIDCFVGFYLTLPVSRTGFWRRWKPAWLIKRKASFYRLNFDLHRASGLWLWPVLFIFAWSSVMFNMRSIYQWIMPKLFDYSSNAEEIAEIAHRPIKEHPPLDWHAAQAVGANLIEKEAVKQGFAVGEAQRLFYFSRAGVYYYTVRSGDIFSAKASATVIFDADTGELQRGDGPAAVRSGEAVTNWLRALHMAKVFGLPYRIFVCALGVVIAMLSVTGVYIWWKKRNARIVQRIRRREDALQPKAAETT